MKDQGNTAGQGKRRVVLTAGIAYDFGYIDGQDGRKDDRASFAPFTAHYAYGYEKGKGDRAIDVAERVQLVERLPLATPVRILSNGGEGVISAHASADSTRYQVTWFSRHFWAVRHVWVNRSNLVIIGSAASADNSAKPAPAASFIARRTRNLWTEGASLQTIGRLSHHDPKT